MNILIDDRPAGVRQLMPNIFLDGCIGSSENRVLLGWIKGSLHHLEHEFEVLHRRRILAQPPYFNT